MSNNSILDSPIEEINIPILKPTRYVPRKPQSMVIRRNFSRFADWIMNLVPRSRRRIVSRRITRLRREIREIYSRYDRLQPYRREAPLRGYLNTYRINGEMGYDQWTFSQYIRPSVIRLLDERKKPFKMKLILACKLGKGDDLIFYYSHSDVVTITNGDDIGKIFNTLISKILKDIDKYQKMGSGWKFEEVMSFDINVDPFVPLRGSSYFPLSYELAVKKAIINPKNEDDKCFIWSVTAGVFQRRDHPELINKEMRENAAKLN